MTSTEKGIWIFVVRIPDGDFFEVPLAGFTQSRHQCHVAFMKVADFVGYDPRKLEIHHAVWENEETI